MASNLGRLVPAYLGGGDLGGKNLERASQGWFPDPEFWKQQAWTGRHDTITGPGGSQPEKLPDEETFGA